MNKIVSHLTKGYPNIEMHNGAYYYSKELVENIIPYVKTKRPWVTIRVFYKCFDNAIVFIHNNLNPDRYIWMTNFKNLVLVVSQPETAQRLYQWFPQARFIYLPLSIDTKYVKQFRTKKTKEVAFVGRLSKCTKEIKQNDKIDKLGDLPREELLKEMAKYKKVYAVGRCALEAKVLGCEVLQYDPRYPKDIWDVYDNKEVIPILQKRLNQIDLL